MTHTGTQRQPNRPAARGGMTLIEMLVAVGILTLIMMGFGMILGETQKLVVSSQATMQSNSTAQSIAHTIRTDLRNLSRAGFLYADADTLMFTTAGTVFSITGGAKGTGSVISYGLANNEAAGASGGILYRQGWVLSVAPKDGEDHWNTVDFAQVQTQSEGQTGTLITSLLNYAPGGVSGPTLRVPPSSAGDLNNTWQVLAPNCTNLQVAWMDASGAWQNSGSVTVTHHDQRAWPRAIRLRFNIDDPQMPEAFRDVEYEVVCPIGN